MTQTEALRLALEALEICEQDGYIPVRLTRDSITAIKAALEAKDEPVAYPEGDVVGPCICGSWPGGKCLKCPRTTPPQRKPLTDEEIKEAVLNDAFGGLALLSMMRDEVMIADVRQAINRIARAIEATHEIKGEA